MAIYHLHHGFISRSSGRSSVQSAAYIAGEKLYEERREIIADYTKRKNDVICIETLAPEKSKYKDITVWNEVEKFEDKYAEKHYKTEETITNYKECAQTASTIVLALPNELSIEKNRELLEDFINTRFTNRGLISTYAIHKNEGNIHAHIQTTRRAINEETGEFRERKDRAICTKRVLIETRKLWADLTNEYLEKEGILERINEKSFVDLGIDLLPTKHRRWYGDAIGNEITKRFAKNTDIVLDPINGPYSWDIIEEFENDIMLFVDFIFGNIGFDDLEKRELESYFFSQINKETSKDNKKIDLLRDIIFNLQGLGDKLKEKFISQFGYLKLLINNHQKVTLSRYIKGNGNILLFMPCNENPDLIKIANMFKTLAKDTDTFVIENLNDY